MVVERHTHTEKTQEKKTTIREETHDRHELDHHTFTRWLHSHAGTHTGRFNIKQHDGDGAPTRSPRLGLSTVHTRSDGLCARRWSRARKEGGVERQKQREGER